LSIMRRREITEKQLRFCQEYIKDSNCAQAMIRAGYKESYAKHRANFMLSNVVVKAEIDRLKAENRVKYEHTISTAIKMLRHAHDIAEKQANPTGMVSAIKEMDNICGLQQQTIHTDAQEPDKLTPEQIAELKRMSKAATNIRLSKSG